MIPVAADVRRRMEADGGGCWRREEADAGDVRRRMLAT